jgi:hypothetical protein
VGSKNISTLIKDIYAILDNPEPFDEKLVEEFGQSLAKLLSSRLAEERANTTLRLSNWDARCERQLWLKINMPQLVEPLPPPVRLKFLTGDVMEAVLLFLARAAGHSVVGEQDEVQLGGVVGHRDGIIDGRTVDAKSASPYAFRKFADHTLPGDDAFGYIGQLGSYVKSSEDDERVTDKSRGSFLAINKVSGELALDTYEFTESKESIEGRIAAKQKMLDGPMPPRGYSDEEMGKSGNRKLGVACSYCPCKLHCWPGLRAFAYSGGPVYLTSVKDQPRVPEIPIEGGHD